MSTFEDDDVISLQNEDDEVDEDLDEQYEKSVFAPPKKTNPVSVVKDEDDELSDVDEGSDDEESSKNEENKTDECK